MKEELLKHWQIQEGLLQSYRTMFLVSQTLVFLVAAVMTENVPVFCVLIGLGLVLLYTGTTIARARGLDVSYFQMQVLKLERNSMQGDFSGTILDEFKQWQNKSQSEKRRILGEFKLHFSRTRRMMETVLPVTFLILWIVLAAIMLGGLA